MFILLYYIIFYFILFVFHICPTARPTALMRICLFTATLYYSYAIYSYAIDWSVRLLCNFLCLLSFIGFLFFKQASNDLLTPYAFISFLFVNRKLATLLENAHPCVSGCSVRMAIGLRGPERKHPKAHL